MDHEIRRMRTIRGACPVTSFTYVMRGGMCAQKEEPLPSLGGIPSCSRSCVKFHQRKPAALHHRRAR